MLVKIVVVGSKGVGKTALIDYLASGKFKSEYVSTIKEDFRLVEFDIPNFSQKSHLQLWDTTGEKEPPRWGSVLSPARIELAIICVDTTQSFEEIKNDLTFWQDFVQREYRNFSGDFYIVGTKALIYEGTPEFVKQDENILSIREHAEALKIPYRMVDVEKYAHDARSPYGIEYTKDNLLKDLIAFAQNKIIKHTEQEQNHQMSLWKALPKPPQEGTRVWKESRDRRFMNLQFQTILRNLWDAGHDLKRYAHINQPLFILYDATAKIYYSNKFTIGEIELIGNYLRNPRAHAQEFQILSINSRHDIPRSKLLMAVSTAVGIIGITLLTVITGGTGAAALIGAAAIAAVSICADVYGARMFSQGKQHARQLQKVQNYRFWMQAEEIRQIINEEEKFDFQALN